jgi:antitoxin HicB
MIAYAAKFEPDPEGGFVVTFPDFGWGVTEGDSMEEARGMALDCLRSMLQHLMRENEPIPAAHCRPGQRRELIRLPALESAKVELYEALRASGVSRAELARRMGISKGNVERLFNLAHASRMDQMEAAARALDKRVSLSLIDAA